MRISEPLTSKIDTNPMGPGVYGNLVARHVLIDECVRCSENTRSDDEERCLEVLLIQIFE
jgi:hypothetical protein